MGTAESRSDNEAPIGWYSEAVMAFVLRMHHNIYKLDVDDPIRTDREGSAMRIYAPETAGIINQAQQHWTAFKLYDNLIWFLDSCAPAPGPGCCPSPASGPRSGSNP